MSVRSPSLGAVDRTQLRAVASELGLPEDEVLRLVYEADPTKKHEYASWILSQIRAGRVVLPEDASRLIEALTAFEHAKRARPEGVVLDINRYKSIAALEEVTERLQEIATGRERERPAVFRRLPEGAAWHRESDNYVIMPIQDPDTCVRLARGTKWCVRKSAVAVEYLEEYKELFLILLRTAPNKLLVYGLYTPDYSQIMDTLNEPLDVDSELAELMHPQEPLSPKTAYNYAYNVVGPWPPGEETIASDPELAYYYALYVINGPWPPGEEAIARDPQWAYYYARYVIKGLWPPGGPAIASDPELAFLYAHEVIKGPWPPGEEAIARDPWLAYNYAAAVIKGPWPPGEEVIARHPWLAYNYAAVIKGSWPPGEA
jgi:hypothetical protein